MKKAVKQYIVDNKMLENGDKVLVALSGGPDSVCLLHNLWILKEDFNIKIGAIHINHMLRGEEAIKDEEYTKSICKDLNIEYYVSRINIDYISKEKGISIELAGREERYKAFFDIKNKFGYNKIAVAHNANDQIETILMRIMRGTGLEGLTGIKAVREDGIIRPILSIERHDIEKYCEENMLNPRIDESNNEKIYNRNKVRLDIVPYMKDNFNEDIIYTVNRMVGLLQKDNEYIEERAIEVYEKYSTNKGSRIEIKKELFIYEKEAIITRALKIAFKTISNSHKNFEMKHIYEIINLSKIGTGKRIQLPNQIDVENLYGNIIFTKRELKKLKVDNNNICINKKDIFNDIEFLGYRIKIEIINKKNNLQFSNNDLIKQFDYDKIKRDIIIRIRQNGDKIIPIGMKGSKKIKDIFIDLKVAKDKRDEIPIICFDEKISWLVGYKMSEEFKVSNETKKIIQITVEERD